MASDSGVHASGGYLMHHRYPTQPFSSADYKWGVFTSAPSPNNDLAQGLGTVLEDNSDTSTGPKYRSQITGSPWNSYNPSFKTADLNSVSLPGNFPLREAYRINTDE